MFSKAVLDIDPDFELRRITDFMRETVFKDLKRRGLVIGMSGGIDSALVAELCVHAAGRERVLGLILPERESNPVSAEYATKHAQKMGIETIRIDITGYLESLQLYEKRNAVITTIFPEFDESYKFHISLPQNLLETDRFNFHTITIMDGNGKTQHKRLSGGDWLKISACQNMKQRMRMIQLYYHAEKNNYLVAGTTNKAELLQGFYVKYGDGGVDIEPIAHLYKTQVFALAKHLGVIDEIIARPPSPDTYSLPVTDKEFYFCLDYELLDLFLYAYEHHIPVDQVSSVLDLKGEQVERVLRDFKAKEQATRHLRELPPGLEHQG
ncbi:MAG: NAD(+) synthase [bacterium]